PFCQGDPGNGARALPRNELRAGARPLHPHRRRAAHQQLSALATRVHGALFHRHAVARLRRRGARRGDRLVSRPRAALRAHQRPCRAGEAGRGRLKGGLAARIVTAAALFFLPKPWFAALGTVIAAAAGFEWARLCRLAGAAAWLYAAGMAFAFVVLYNTEPRAPASMLAAMFWIV